MNILAKEAEDIHDRHVNFLFHIVQNPQIDDKAQVYPKDAICINLTLIDLIMSVLHLNAQLFYDALSRSEVVYLRVLSELCGCLYVTAECPGPHWPHPGHWRRRLLYSRTLGPGLSHKSQEIRVLE